MKQFRTRGIVLARTDYAEADRILTFLTPDRGKLKAYARGVRKSKSKLAGGIELFSVSDLSLIPGKREIDTVVSTRLIKHFGNIVKDFDRTDVGFGFIKKLHKATEDAPEAGYFYLLEQAFGALDDFKIDLNLIALWFDIQLLRLSGHTPNLTTDVKGDRLSSESKYIFDFEKMHFKPDEGGTFGAEHIKFLRLGFSSNPIRILNRIKQAENLSVQLQPVVQSMLRAHIRI